MRTFSGGDSKRKPLPPSNILLGCSGNEALYSPPLYTPNHHDWVKCFSRCNNHAKDRASPRPTNRCPPQKFDPIATRPPSQADIHDAAYREPASTCLELYLLGRLPESSRLVESVRLYWSWPRL